MPMVSLIKLFAIAVSVASPSLYPPTSIKPSLLGCKLFYLYKLEEWFLHCRLASDSIHKSILFCHHSNDGSHLNNNLISIVSVIFLKAP